MSDTVYRDECGSFAGLRLHQDRGERPCAACLRGEDVRRIERESIPWRPSPPEAWYAPVTSQQAERNRLALEHEVLEFEKAQKAGRACGRGALLGWDKSRRAGRAVRALRLAAGLAQADVALACGFTQEMTSHLERGICRWHAGDAEKAARLLGTDLPGLLRHPVLAVDEARSAAA